MPFFLVREFIGLGGMHVIIGSITIKNTAIIGHEDIFRQFGNVHPVIKPKIKKCRSVSLIYWLVISWTLGYKPTHYL